MFIQPSFQGKDFVYTTEMCVFYGRLAAALEHKFIFEGFCVIQGLYQNSTKEMNSEAYCRMRSSSVTFDEMGHCVYYIKMNFSMCA